MVAVSKDHIWSVNNQGQLWEWVDGRSPAWIEHKIPFPGFYYTVVWGDTLTSIAKHFGKTVQDLLDANPSIVNPDLIFPGQVILIPA
ncbi:MAG: LysM peptidoglycan-binding domain-containing protein [Anaerolineae bacterium]|nr:LysM peptidoglycan-binding domain-containing protein [Anaerolineae bacterium]